MTILRTKKLFISYRSSDAVKVDKIAFDLTLLKYDDGAPRYTTWQDKHNLPPASPNWWDAIVDAIEQCDMFVFHLSRASLQSDVCRAELEYAHRRNRPIIPVVLEGEFFLNAQSGKYDLLKETWALVPEWLGQAQFLFYVETQFYSQFQEAVAVFERNWPRAIPAPRPLNPDSKAVHGSNHALYTAACDYAGRLAFADAEKHFDTLVRRNDRDYVEFAAQWLDIIRRYAELIEIVERRSPIFNKRWAEYQSLFPNEIVEGIFDPKDFAKLQKGRRTPKKVAPENPSPAPHSTYKSAETPAIEISDTEQQALQETSPQSATETVSESEPEPVRPSDDSPDVETSAVDVSNAEQQALQETTHQTSPQSATKTAPETEWELAFPSWDSAPRSTPLPPISETESESISLPTNSPDAETPAIEVSNTEQQALREATRQAQANPQSAPEVTYQTLPKAPPSNQKWTFYVALAGLFLVFGIIGSLILNNNALTPNPTATPTLRPTSTLTPTPLGPQTNADWTPIEREFDGVTMVLVPAGCFDMGSDDGASDEQPIHEICFDEPFWIDKYEVTNEQYGSIGCDIYSSEPDQPRNCVDWFDARDFCEARGGSLPTEPQWEYAARGPSAWVYPWGNDFISENAVYSSNSGSQTADVGSRPGGASWVGAMDMSGNVWEWTSSLYLDYPYGANHESNTDTSSRRVLRGGSFDLDQDLLRGANRIDLSPANNRNTVGFRCVRPPSLDSDH